MTLHDNRAIHHLFLLNICLQLFDGIATYHAAGTPAGEGNPILAAAMTEVGMGSALLLFKAKACGCLVLLRRMAHHSIVGTAFVLLAATYGLFSFLPWMLRILQML